MPPTPLTHPTHIRWMQRCIELAGKGIGHVSPNPMVGSVIVSAEGKVLGEGWHRKYGTAHAERNAVEQAERLYGAEVLKSATIYVNLEPCSHFGKTPPCSRLILEKQIPRVVVGMIDPYSEVSGRGIQMLRDKQVAVTVGVLEAACKRLNEAFTHHVTTSRPLVTLKMAQTLDSHIATESGHSKWVTGEAARTAVHQSRTHHDAVVVGSGTALADNPSLTIRHIAGPQPYRVVLDKKGTLPTTLKVFTDEFVDKTIVITAEQVTPAYLPQLQAAGGEHIQVGLNKNHLDLTAALTQLGTSNDRRAGLQSVLVEAGPHLASALFQHDLIDRFQLYIAPKLLGTGLPALHAITPSAITNMEKALTFADYRWQQVGDDMLFEGYLRSL